MKPILLDSDSFVKQSQYCWCPSEARSQDISMQATELLFIEYSYALQKMA